MEQIIQKNRHRERPIILQLHEARNLADIFGITLRELLEKMDEYNALYAPKTKRGMDGVSEMIMNHRKPSSEILRKIKERYKFVKVTFADNL
jgi:hypothetical protein